MKIGELMHKSLIIPNLSSKDKEDVLREMVECIVRKEADISGSELLRVLMEREELDAAAVSEILGPRPSEQPKPEPA